MCLTRRHVLAMLGAGGGFFLISFGVWAAGNDEKAIIALFNQIRREHGLGMMVADAQLEAVASSQAQLMAKKGKLSHVVGWGNGFKARLRKAGVRGFAAENIAAGQKDFRAAFAAWMASHGHRRNMLDPRFSCYGLAYASTSAKPDYRYWAIVLGR